MDILHDNHDNPRVIRQCLYYSNNTSLFLNYLGSNIWNARVLILVYFEYSSTKIESNFCYCLYNSDVFFNFLLCPNMREGVVQGFPSFLFFPAFPPNKPNGPSKFVTFETTKQGTGFSYRSYCYSTGSIRLDVYLFYFVFPSLSSIHCLMLAYGRSILSNTKRLKGQKIFTW